MNIFNYYKKENIYKLIATLLANESKQTLLVCNSDDHGSYYSTWLAPSFSYAFYYRFSYGYLLHYAITLFTLRKEERSSIYLTIIDVIAVNVNIFTAYTSVIMNFYYEKKFQIYMKRLAAVDDTLEKLGSPKIYRKMHVLSKRMTIGWIMCTFIANSCDTFWWLNKIETASWGLVLGHIMNFCFHINAFVDLFFVFLLRYIGTRFDEVNKHVRCLLVKENHGLRCTWKKFIVLQYRYYKQTLWTSMKISTRICRTLLTTCYLNKI